MTHSVYDMLIITVIMTNTARDFVMTNVACNVLMTYVVCDMLMTYVVRHDLYSS